jgi:methylglutaconyl-CoA hydratase
MNPVKITRERDVMTATLADAKNRNALGPELVEGLREAVAAVNADPKLRALVVTNEGTTFCAGANLRQWSGAAQRGSASGGFEVLLHEIQTSPTPIVGRIDGHVVGGGNGLAAALDISIAADHVKFGFSEVRLGVAPAIISVVCLPKMRPGDALEAFLRGHRFTAARAAELGLINRAVPVGDLDAAVAEVLSDLRKGGPRALGFAKRLVYEVPRMTTQEAFRWTSALSSELFASEEAREGMTAFLEKRDPEWARSDGD